MRVTKQEFAARRKRLMDLMGSNSIAIVPAAIERIRNRDVEYYYRQDSDFYYLSGFDEARAVLVLMPGREHGEYVMFCQEKDREKEQWTGYRVGPEAFVEQYSADDAFPIGDLDEILPGLIEGTDRVYYSMGRDPEFDRQVMAWLNTIRAKTRSGATPPGEFVDLNHFLHDMRLYKSAAEVRVMREAGQISAEAHKKAMTICQPGMKEYELEAEIVNHFMKSGCRWEAYLSIVGSGSNACILHYTANRDVMKDGDLVLIDAGCELEYYAADITRTFPVNGKFSPEQAAIYNLVLKAQLASIATVKPGEHWNRANEVVIDIITAGLVELGLLEGDVDELIEKEVYKAYYMHRAGHWLGMDVHDVGDYKVDGEWRLLEPGMVLTVEPGIYISPDDETVEAKWRGIGVRIEDDVLVTKNGNEVMTADVPKHIDEIERLMAG